MSELNDIVERARANLDEDYIEYLKSISPEHRFDLEIEGKCRIATRGDYLEWLAGYLKSFGTITHSYDYMMPMNRWIVVTKNLDLHPLHGAKHYYLIVPKGITVNIVGQGHHSLYYMYDFTQSGGFVPIYKDTVF